MTVTPLNARTAAALGELEERAIERIETLKERIARAQAEVRALSREQVTAMRAHVAEGIAVARDVVANGAQPDGIRQLAEKIVRENEAALLCLDALISRSNT